MVPAEREVFIDLSPAVRIRYRRSQPPPPINYAITLEILEGAQWMTIRLWDNADHPDEHHEHAYTKAGGKQPAAILRVDSTNEAMATAIREAAANATKYVQTWEAEER